MAGNIAASNERFQRAVVYLALSNGTYRDRLQKALGEALHDIGKKSPPSIPDELHKRMHEFVWRIRPVIELSDEEAENLGRELLILASDTDYESRRDSE